MRHSTYNIIHCCNSSSIGPKDIFSLKYIKDQSFIFFPHSIITLMKASGQDGPVYSSSISVAYFSDRVTWIYEEAVRTLVVLDVDA